MPQIHNQEEKKLKATSVEENRPFRERLRDRYKPTQHVRVINIDNEAFEWIWFPDDGEEESFDSDGLMRQIDGRQHFSSNYRTKLPGNEQEWIMPAGDTEVLYGSCADLFIEGLFKKLVAKKRISETPGRDKTSAINFNWNDGLLQEQMIDKIFLGIEQPTFQGNKTNEPERSQTPAKK